MILAGQKDAKKRVFLFFSIFFVTGLISELSYTSMSYIFLAVVVFGIGNMLYLVVKKHLTLHKDQQMTLASLVLEVIILPFLKFLKWLVCFFQNKQALFVPSQGFLNALAYGWTRGDFLSVMSVRRCSRRLSESAASPSYESMEEEEEEEEEEETEDERERKDEERMFQPANSPFSSDTT